MTIAPLAATGAGRQGARFEVMPAEAALGAEVRGLDLRTLDDATFAALHRAWLHHIVLAFRGQTMTAEDLVVLVRRFGTPVTSSKLHHYKLEGRAANRLYNLPPEVTVVSNVRDRGESIGILGDGDVLWHSDFSFKERPTAARMLVAMEVPARELGGNTFFMNCYAAYDALP
ncbi:MAG TPA: TauD/TfdA family dioxygenase, partial [Burkholderiales bacterium]|nr:TauD/TfdA family dioxygenase [Burkholderiales bacterium]